MDNRNYKTNLDLIEQKGKSKIVYDNKNRLSF